MKHMLNLMENYLNVNKDNSDSRMPCLEYLSLCALCDVCESNMMSMKASARTRSVFLSPLFVSNWGQNIKRVWLFLSWQGNELPQTWNDDQRSIFWFVSSSFGVFSGKFFPFYSCQFATALDCFPKGHWTPIEGTLAPRCSTLPMASVPSLGDTGHIWHRILSTTLKGFLQIKQKYLGVIQIGWGWGQNVYYWHFHVYIVTCVGQKSASHIPAPHLSPDSPSGPFSRCWYWSGSGFLCLTRLQNGVAASRLQPPSIAENLPDGWTGPRASQ